MIDQQKLFYNCKCCGKILFFEEKSKINFLQIMIDKFMWNWIKIVWKDCK